MLNRNILLGASQNSDVMGFIFQFNDQVGLDEGNPLDTPLQLCTQATGTSTVKVLGATDKAVGGRGFAINLGKQGMLSLLEQLTTNKPGTSTPIATMWLQLPTYHGIKDVRTIVISLDGVNFDAPRYDPDLSWMSSLSAYNYVPGDKAPIKPTSDAVSFCNSCIANYAPIFTITLG